MKYLIVSLLYIQAITLTAIFSTLLDRIFGLGSPHVSGAGPAGAGVGALAEVGLGVFLALGLSFALLYSSRSTQWPHWLMGVILALNLLQLIHFSTGFSLNLLASLLAASGLLYVWGAFPPRQALLVAAILPGFAFLVFLFIFLTQPFLENQQSFASRIQGHISDPMLLEKDLGSLRFRLFPPNWDWTLAATFLKRETYAPAEALVENPRILKTPFVMAL